MELPKTDMDLLVTRHRSKEPIKGWRKVNAWSFKGPLLVLALLLGFFDHSLHWGRAPFAAGLAMIIPIIGFRDFWNKSRFWVTVVLLTILQIPIVIGLGPLIEQLRFPAMLTFGILDCAVMIVAVSWVCSRGGGGPE